jgi:uracil-DNA glycosylase
MAMEITIQVPEALGRQLQPFRERLSEMLERGLREILAGRSGDFQDENAIMELLTSQPRPEQVLAIYF